MGEQGERAEQAEQALVRRLAAGETRSLVEGGAGIQAGGGETGQQRVHKSVYG